MIKNVSYHDSDSQHTALVIHTSLLLTVVHSEGPCFTNWYNRIWQNV